MPKNIVILSDATSFEGGMGYSSNVYKIYNAIEIHDNDHPQITFYDHGLRAGWAVGVGFTLNSPSR